MKRECMLMLFGVFACSKPEKKNDTRLPDVTTAVQETLSVGSSDTVSDNSTAVAKRDTLIQYDESVYSIYVPAKIDSLIKTELKQWSLPSPSRWDKFWFNDYKTDHALVNVVPGDFNCDQKTDCALLMQKQTGEVAVWVVQTSSKGYEYHKLVEYGKAWGPIEVGLELLPAGEYNQIDPGEEGLPPVIFTCQGIQIVAFEKSAEAYYWDKGNFKSIQTGD